MKKTINGKTYNTETAEKVAMGSNDLMTTDCFYRSEELYRTKKGAYFICDSASNLIAVSDDGKIAGDPTCQYVTEIFDWLEFWNVDLDDRECDFFGVIDA